MILAAQQLLNAVITDQFGKGAMAQVGYDLSVSEISCLVGNDPQEESGDKVFCEVFADNSKTLPTYVKLQPQVLLRKKHVGTEAEYQEAYKGWQLDRGIYSLTFDQGVSLSETQTAFVHHRSTLLRMGIVITSAVYDPGFATQQMGAIMFVSRPVRIEIHSKLAQLVVHENYATTLYQGQYQGHKDIK